jgi:hypothetical protein
MIYIARRFCIKAFHYVYDLVRKATVSQNVPYYLSVYYVYYILCLLGARWPTGMRARLAMRGTEKRVTTLIEM